MTGRRQVALRPSEWLILAFFAYIAFISLFFDRPHLHVTPFAEFLFITSILMLVAGSGRERWQAFFSHLRDWLPLLYTLLAFREMELFLPASFDSGLEASWIKLDRVLLDDYHLRAVIQGLGLVIPLYLELCYLLVYGMAAICVWILYSRAKRRFVDQYWVIYLSGTLLAYALFPYFPSRPPRIVYAGLDNPGVSTWVRELNLFILRRATIHVGVFPSAHVSAAFACTWAMFLLFPERKRIGWLLLIYSVSVSVATVYGRYHYAADVLAGFGVSLVAAAVAVWLAKKKKAERLETSRPSTTGSKIY
ncbi:MAG TPA: phosphatase PAP2 family protein [Bryobacteraceae bacterium]|nr:phosphatase PAP2 family protein [Bryobacteraceae bacterium]